MDQHEEFARISIDRPSAGKWEGAVPSINYWTYKVNRQVLSVEQSAFYNYFCEALERGSAVDLGGQYGYVSLCKDDLISKYFSHQHNDKEEIVRLAKLLITLYDYKGQDIEAVLSVETKQNRQDRLAHNMQHEPARWISVGESVEAGGLSLQRGGFYLGTHLQMWRYLPWEGAFESTPSIVEGPVVDLSLSSDRQSARCSQATTMAEMQPEMRRKLIDWLSSDSDQIRVPEAFAYYLAGMEFRLLADRKANDRVQIMQYLHSLMRAPGVLMATQAFNYHNQIRQIIDRCLARFYADSTVDFLPDDFVSSLPAYTYAKSVKAINRILEQGVNEFETAKEISRIMPIPQGLPQMFADKFRMQFMQFLFAELRMRGTPVLDSNLASYQAVREWGVYQPSDMIQQALKGPALKMNDTVNIVFNKVQAVYKRMLSSVSRFITMVQAKQSPLALATTLPSWLKESDVPGVDEAKARIAPKNDDSFRMVPMRDLMAEFGMYPSTTDYVDKADFGTLLMRMYRFGLRIGISYGVLRVRIDDQVPVLSEKHGDIPHRGTLGMSLYLIAWMLEGDGAQDRDLDLVDQWLMDYDRKADWAVTAQGSLRWLLGRRLAMSAKRKEKAKRLIKTIKRRDELMQLLLQLVALPQGASPKRMQRLQTIYQLVGLDPNTIHSDIHRLSTGATHVKQSKRNATASSALDKTVLRQMEHSTAQAKEMLAEVFTEDKEEKERGESREARVQRRETRVENPTIEMLKALINKELWSRQDFEALAKTYGLTTGAAMEQINDLAFDTVDEAVVNDDGDQVSIDIALSKEIIDKH